MKLRYVIEIEPLIEPSEISKEWGYKYYAALIELHLKRHFRTLKLYSFDKGKKEF